VFCPKCGTNNLNEARFCAGCGGPLNEQINNRPTSGLGHRPSAQSTPSDRTFNYLQFIIAVLLRPVTTIWEQIHRFYDTKLSLVFAGIIAVSMMLANVFRTVLEVVMVKNYDIFRGKYTTTMTWANIDSIKWLDIILKNLIIYAIILGLIAGVYYLAGILLKRETDYRKILAIVSVSVVPLVLATFILSPILGIALTDLGAIVSLIGITYTFVILINSISLELGLEDGNLKAYVHLLCLTVLFILAYFVIKYIELDILNDFIISI